MELTKPLEQFVDQLAASDFLCAICFEVPHYNSYVETDCGHFFCIKHKPNLYTECAICKGMIFDYININYFVIIKCMDVLGKEIGQIYTYIWK